MGIHLKCLTEVLLMSTYNIWFHGEVRKILCGYPLLSGAMPTAYVFMEKMEKYLPDKPSCLVLKYMKFLDINLFNLAKEYRYLCKQCRSDETARNKLSYQNLYCLWFCLFILRFYSPVNPIGSYHMPSVYLTTLLAGSSEKEGFIKAIFAQI